MTAIFVRGVVANLWAMTSAPSTITVGSTRSCTTPRFVRERTFNGALGVVLLCIRLHAVL